MKRGALPEVSIWWFAFGYFACYAPYSALTKALTDQLLPSLREPLSGFELLPSTVMASTVGMFTFISAFGLWRHASHAQVLGVSLPVPTRFTFLSGLCTAGIIATTTLAYTFEGVSIVFVMLLMRGGVLAIAPVVDLFTGRNVRWFSWVALGLSLLALFVAFAERAAYDLTLLAGVDIALYLLAYFVRLRFMTRIAKSADVTANLRYFVEEQLVASPVLLLGLCAVAWLGSGPIASELAAGFTTFFSRPVVLEAGLVGLLSQGAGIFGGLILLDKRENTFCVPVNRSSSILAGLLASVGLATFVGSGLPSGHEVAGAALILTAILFLTLPPMAERRRARAIDQPR